MPNFQCLRPAALLGASVLAACSGTTATDSDPGPGQNGLPPSGQPATHGWFAESTVALRSDISLPSASTRLLATPLAQQLADYDPGSPLRCAVEDDPAYAAAIDTLGGVTWGYPVSLLADLSKPLFRLGPSLQLPAVAGATSNDSAGAAVEIEKADIVGVSETNALFYSSTHGLLLVDLSQPQAQFVCAAKLPGQVRDFYYYQGHLVVMVASHLLHFKVAGTSLEFVELVELDGPVLDTRRFNDRLVVYTSGPVATASAQGGSAGDEQGVAISSPTFAYTSPHRALQVFRFGDALTEELHETLRNTSANEAYLNSGVVAADTAIGSVLYTGSAYGDTLWASDHYFVVPDAVQTTTLTGWQTQYYSVCTSGHTFKTSERYCTTTYETRPNPDYTPPDNSGGDRACKGTTLSDCLHAVARASNKTIQVPVGTKCEVQEFDAWACDNYDYRSYTYPTTETHTDTRLTIFSYSADGFVQLDSKVQKITTAGVEGLAPDAHVATLSTSTDSFDLSVPGALQTLYFQHGFLYAVADGVLQTYSMGEGSLVRTSELRVVGNTLQTALFSDTKLYLSDYRYDLYGSDHSVLRVFDLSNPAFPKQASQDRELAGGHNSILATSLGILTLGGVQNFEGNPGNVLKLGLFSDPFTTEKAYLILGTDLSSPVMGQSESSSFDSAENRLFLPYTGGEENDPGLTRARIGVSHLADDAIVSEGALHMSELIERVRARQGVADQWLGFGQSSISLLTPGEKEWMATPLLDYYTPVALYRIDDQDNYAEVLRLGSRCKLRVVAKGKLNVRDDNALSEAFDCGGSVPWAFGENLVFSETTGISFDVTGQVTPLTVAQISAFTDSLAQRVTCLFSDTPTNAAVDFSAPPPLSDLKCYTAEQYQRRFSSL